MREFARVLPSFWTGETGRRLRALGVEAQLMGLYLITCPHADAFGLFRLPLPYVAHDTGLSIEGASKALRSLSEAGFADYEEASESVWVPEMARVQIGESLKPTDKRHAWVATELEKRRKHPFFGRFIERYRQPYALKTEGPSEGLAGPSDAKSKSKSKSRIKKPSSSDEPTTPSEGAQIRAVFDHWVTVMRRNPKTTKLDSKREGKIRARLREGRTVEELCRAVDGCRASAWHMGDNPDGQRHDDIELICRNAVKLENFLGGSAAPETPGQTSMDALLGQVAASRAANAKRHEVPAS